MSARRALVVDDSKSARIVLSRMLEKYGLEVDSAESAEQALDMALGRGGDQAAVKTKDEYEFFGGVSKSVEKVTKFQTRVAASSLSSLISASDRVMIMGHSFPDMDAFGYDGEIELPRWFMLGLLAAVALMVAIAIGQAFLFRFLLTRASPLLKLLCDVGMGGILFLIGYYTVPKDA